MDAKLFTAAALRYFHIGPRTRRYRKDEHGRRDMHRAVADAIRFAVTEPGYFSENTQTAFRIGWSAINGYEKHILGYRARPEVVAHVNGLSAYGFVKLLADMIDAGVSNNGEAERFFQGMSV